MDTDNPIELRAVFALKGRAEVFTASTGAGYHNLWDRTC
jgi:hypothetical protein